MPCFCEDALNLYFLLHCLLTLEPKRCTNYHPEDAQFPSISVLMPEKVVVSS